MTEQPATAGQNESQPTTEKLWVIYDGRACGAQGTDDAMVLCCARSLKEARKDCRMFGFECAVYVYDCKGDELVNEQWEEDYRP